MVYSKAANSSFLSGKYEENVLVVSSELKRRGKREKKQIQIVIFPSRINTDYLNIVIKVVLGREQKRTFQQIPLLSAFLQAFIPQERHSQNLQVMMVEKTLKPNIHNPKCLKILIHAKYLYNSPLMYRLDDFSDSYSLL